MSLYHTAYSALLVHLQNSSPVCLNALRRLGVAAEEKVHGRNAAKCARNVDQAPFVQLGDITRLLRLLRYVYVIHIYLRAAVHVT